MKRNRFIILLGSAFAVAALILCTVLGYRWHSAEQRFLQQRDEILHHFYDTLTHLWDNASVWDAPPLLDENREIHSSTVAQLLSETSAVISSCMLVDNAVNSSPSGPPSDEWLFFDTMQNGSNNCCLRNFLVFYQGALSDLIVNREFTDPNSFPYRPEGRALQLAYELDELMRLYNNALIQVYTECQPYADFSKPGDVYQFYDEYILPGIQKQIVENKEFAKMIDKLTNLRTLVAS